MALLDPFIRARVSPALLRKSSPVLLKTEALLLFIQMRRNMSGHYRRAAAARQRGGQSIRVQQSVWRAAVWTLPVKSGCRVPVMKARHLWARGTGDKSRVQAVPQPYSSESCGYSPPQSGDNPREYIRNVF